MPATLPLLPLDLLQAGESGCVASLEGPPAAVHRLEELGLRSGQTLKMLRPGPPHLVQLGEFRLCLRAHPDVVVLIAATRG